MTDKKKYKKLCRKYRKELKKITKETYPWDYGFMLNYFTTCIKFMKEYYTLGYNIWSSEPGSECPDELKEIPTRLETISNALKEYEAYLATEDKYFIKHETGGKENKKGILVKGEHTDWWFEDLLPNKKANREAYIKEETEHWNKFWDIVKKYLRYWWD